jgi:hypothetical protein
MSTVQEILTAMDTLSQDELRVLKVGVDSRLEQDDDPDLRAALEVALAEADAHPGEGLSVEEVRALIPKWVSESKSTSLR